MARHAIPLVQFRKGQRKDDVMKEHLIRFGQDEGVVLVGKAQAHRRRLPNHRRPGRGGRRRASGLRFADARVQSLLHALVLFRLLANGFRAADLRSHLAALSGCNPRRSPRRNHLSASSPASPRPDRAITRTASDIASPNSVFGRLLFTRDRRILRPGLAAALPALRAIDRPAQARLRQHRRAGQYMGQPSSTRPQQNLTHLLQVSSLKLS